MRSERKPTITHTPGPRFSGATAMPNVLTITQGDPDIPRTTKLIALPFLINDNPTDIAIEITDTDKDETNYYVIELDRDATIALARQLTQNLATNDKYRERP